MIKIDDNNQSLLGIRDIIGWSEDVTHDTAAAAMVLCARLERAERDLTNLFKNIAKQGVEIERLKQLLQPTEE